MNKVFVYGTLRPRNSHGHVHVRGFLYDLGWFPGILLDPMGQDIVCEILEVDDEKLEQLDRYEGYYPDDEEGSLYVRRRINIDGVDGFIYEYNRPIKSPSLQLIRTGDWNHYHHSRKEA